MVKMLKTSPEGRKCLFPHCTHILSIYNHNTYCHVHLDQMLEDQKKLAWGTTAPPEIRVVNSGVVAKPFHLV